jgi:hypothetical protein
VTGDTVLGEEVSGRDEKACLLIWFILMQVENTGFSVLFIGLPSGCKMVFV